MLIRQKMMSSVARYILFLGIIIFSIPHSFSQSAVVVERPITTAVPFLRIIPDARSSAMGDAGIGLSPDANSAFYNSAKLPFSEKKAGVSLSYSPWLRSLGVTDVYMLHLGSFYKFNEQQAIQASMKFFSLGNIVFTDNAANQIGESRPQEMAIDLGYSIKLSDRFGLGANIRYIYSNLAAGQSVNGVAIKPGHAVGVDIYTFYLKEKMIGKKKDLKSEISFGAGISNLGSKISYTNSAENQDFIPANLGIGAGYAIHIDKQNKIGIYVDMNKLMAPSFDTTGNFRNQSSISAAFKSFADAPGGFKEEMKEIMWSIGTEYWFREQFAIRGGYFHEAESKGNRKYVTAGIGVRYSVFGLDFSYLAPITSRRNPLDNTIRFTLNFNFGDKKESSNELVPAQ